MTALYEKADIEILTVLKYFQYTLMKKRYFTILIILLLILPDVSFSAKRIVCEKVPESELSNCIIMAGKEIGFSEDYLNDFLKNNTFSSLGISFSIDSENDDKSFIKIIRRGKLFYVVSQSESYTSGPRKNTSNSTRTFKSNTKPFITTRLVKKKKIDRGTEISLTKAIRGGNIGRVKEIVGSEVDINKTNSLSEAVNANNLPILKILLSSGADPNQGDKKGHSIYLAAKKDNQIYLETLLKYKANLDIENPADTSLSTPLIKVISENNYEAAKRLLSYGSNPDVRLRWGDTTPLHQALLMNNEKIVKLLLEHGAKTFIRNRNGITAKKYSEMMDIDLIKKISLSSRIISPRLMICKNVPFNELSDCIRKAGNKIELGNRSIGKAIDNMKELKSGRKITTVSFDSTFQRKVIIDKIETSYNVHIKDKVVKEIHNYGDRDSGYRGNVLLTRPVFVRGKVIDETTSKPLKDVIVVARWVTHITTFMSGTVMCYRVETARTNSNGEFKINALVQPPIGADDAPDNKPGIVVYKEGYQTSLSPSQHSVSRAPFPTIGTERLVMPKENSMIYLVPTALEGTDRIRYLELITRAARCFNNHESLKNLTPLLTEIGNEAKNIAVTSYDRYLVERIYCDIEEVNNYGTECVPGFIETPEIKVVTSRKSEDTMQARMLDNALKLPNADPNARDRNHQTALMIAASRGKADLVKILINAGADPNIYDGRGYTALHKAVIGAMTNNPRNPTDIKKYEETVRALLSAPNININKKTIEGKGKTALDLMKNKAPKYNEILRLLQEKEHTYNKN